jgi:LmbE family N-acetylglucosaminyl deacetylase
VFTLLVLALLAVVVVAAARGSALGAVLLLLIALPAGGALWLETLFEHPEAEPIESLAAELGSERLLAVFAHPDDEVMAAGALQDAAERGVRVHAITVTRGEKGTPDIPVEGGPEGLAEVRVAELMKHGRVLGFSEQLVWALPDREVDRHLDAVTADLAREMRRIEPDTVLTFHPGSGYTYHPDHRAVGEAATAAVARARERDGAEITLVYLLGPSRVMGLLGGEIGARIEASQPPAQYALKIDPQIKLRGWEIHASQGRFIERNFKVPKWVIYRYFFDEEHYRVAD